VTLEFTQRNGDVFWSEISFAPIPSSHGDVTHLVAVTEDVTDGRQAQAISGIFQPFYTTKQKGTGFGMAISQRFVEAHRGMIRASSSDNGGALIPVQLPRTRPEGSETELTEPRASQSP